ncbi:MAG: TIGR00730 family Rossman fold protein [Nitrospirota bacterium]|nr:TIGR00730 family Rossman fold protein [Nitrospirota bacterium]
MQLHFTRTNGLVDEAIDRLISQAEGVRRPEYVREMILSALKAGQEDDERADIKLMNSTLKEMRFTAKVFGPYRQVRKVTVFGSARTSPDEPVYQMAQDFGRALAAAGFMAITGGGGGIMRAVNEGAGPEHSFGVNIRLPFEQNPNPVLAGNPRLITYKYFFNRKVAFLKEAHAIALFPGGFGTLDEAMETLTLVQTGKRDPLPLILIDEPGGSYWKAWIRFFEEEMLTRGYVTGSDFDLFERVDSIEAAVEKIKHFYKRYHSLRYVEDRLVVRLLAPLEPDQVRDLQERFRDMLAPGGRMELSSADEAEAGEEEIIRLPRLVVDFNRRDFGRLRNLINAINEY